MRLLILFSCLIVLLIVGCSETDDSPLEAEATALSGTVIDIHGTPIANLPLFVQYIQVDPDGVETPSNYLQNKTDKTGHFSFSNITPGRIQFRLTPDDTPDDLTPYQLISVKIGEIDYYPNDLSSPYSTGYVAAFALTADTRLEDVQVRVKEKMRIRAKVAFKNGMPLANWPLLLDTDYKSPTGSYGYRTEIHTDIHGYFTRYVSRDGYYRITVKYKHLTAMSEMFLLNDGEHREDLLLTFDAHPIAKSISTRN